MGSSLAAEPLLALATGEVEFLNRQTIALQSSGCTGNCDVESRNKSFCWSVSTDEITWSEELYRIFEFDTNVPVTLERIISRVHPDDLPLVQDIIERVRHAADDFEDEHRLLMPDQSIKHIHLFAHAAKDNRLYGLLGYSVGTPRLHRDCGSTVSTECRDNTIGHS